MAYRGDSANIGKIQRDEEEILKEIIKKVKEFIEYSTKSLAQNSGKKTNSKKLSNRLSILVNGKTVFQSNMNQQEKIGSVSLEDIKQIENAIRNPSNSSSDVKIKLGKQILFNVEEGQLLVDKLNLSPAAKQEQSLSLEQRLEQLTKIVGQQQKQIELLEKRIDQKLKFISQNTSQLKSKKLNNWMSNLGNKLSEAWNNVKSTIKNFIDSRIQNVTEKVAAVSAKFLEKPVNFVLDKYGRQENPGILSFQGEKYSYHRNMKSGELSIVSNSTQNNIVDQGDFTSKASPEDIKILKELPEKIKSNIAQDQSQTKTRSRGRSR